MSRIGRTGGVLATVGVALLALLVVPALAAPASAAPVGVAVGSSQQWAYGAEKWFNSSVTLPNATISAHAFFGWDVVFTATNTSLTTQAWEAQRTMAGFLYVNFSSASSHGNFSMNGWEVDTGFANLSTTASVYQNGSPVPAIGLVNASFENAANLTDRLTFSIGTGPITGTSASMFDAAGTAHGAVAFAPALGLVPLNLTSGSHWNSSSAFTAAGGWTVDYSASHTGFSGPAASGSFTAGGTLNATGELALFGADLGTTTLANGLTLPVVVLAWSGPFDDVDGVILIPHAFDLFGDASHVWDHDNLATQSVATSDLDLRVGSDHHLRVDAAAAAFGSAATSLPVSSGPTGPAPMASSASPSVVQAQPESVAQAQQNSACLTGACASGPARGLVGVYVVLGVAGAIVAASIGLLLYRRGRRGGRSPAAGMTPVAPPAGALGASVSEAHSSP